MSINSCHRCGSLNLVADRALAGKIICANCGSPVLNYTFKRNNSVLNINKAKKIIIFLALFMLVLILIV